MKCWVAIMVTIGCLLWGLPAQAIDYNVSADEPTENKGGGALDDLDVIKFHFQEENLAIQIQDGPVSSPQGGGRTAITVTISDPPMCQKKTIQFWAIAVDTSGNPSEPTPKLAKTIDRTQDVSCTTPKAPSNFTVVEDQ